MAEFASKWPNVRRWAIERVRGAVTADRVSAERDEKLKRQVVLSIAPSRLETSVSRQYLVTVECWAHDNAATAKDDAFELCTDAAYSIESAPRSGSPVVRAELNAGPAEDRDEAGNYFYTATILVVVHRLP
ncbi:hypothetical protein F6W69_10665 [Microbacterium oxydans]|uniref:hypothetical protein n=1 Tax=Microbacterium oxydans TaxID=82380 RepID=UPI001141724C|nr:hypothetical protein [Microbacterium oxydans]KAB1891051.1 hypothetical protein F6W69_10665 [Microbacterium oxydans]GED39088.1 hypothetical protein MOX01_22300 [Microbacterium oxydans]